MPDKYSQRLDFKVSDAAELWKVMAVIERVVDKYDYKDQNTTAYKGNVWKLHEGGRSWERHTLKEVVEVYRSRPFELFAIWWSYRGADLQWMGHGQTYDGGGASLQVTAYAGTDRLRTEEVVRDVVESLRKKSISPSVEDIEISSTDGSTTAGHETKLSPRKVRPFWTKIGAAVGNHAVATISGIVATIVGGLLLFKFFGIGG